MDEKAGERRCLEGFQRTSLGNGIRLIKAQTLWSAAAAHLGTADAGRGRAIPSAPGSGGRPSRRFQRHWRGIFAETKPGQMPSPGGAASAESGGGGCRSDGAWKSPGGDFERVGAPTVLPSGIPKGFRPSAQRLRVVPVWKDRVTLGKPRAISSNPERVASWHHTQPRAGPGAATPSGLMIFLGT